MKCASPKMGRHFACQIFPKFRKYTICLSTICAFHQYAATSYSAVYSFHHFHGTGFFCKWLWGVFLCQSIPLASSRMQSTISVGSAQFSPRILAARMPASPWISAP